MYLNVNSVKLKKQTKFKSIDKIILACIICLMKRIATQDNSIQKRILINIPFVLLILIMLIFFGGSILFLMYSIIFGVAFKSAMISLIIASAGLISLAIGLGAILLYKKYYDFYNKKMGWQIPTSIEEKQASNVVRNSIKEYLTIPNVALAILALGCLFAIISATLGAMQRDNWVDATKSYKEQNGFYEDIQYQEHKYEIESPTPGIDNINTISIKTLEKTVFIKYSDEEDFITVQNYIQFKNQITISRTSDGIINIEEHEITTNNTSLEKMLFFVFKDYKAEKQIVIVIPNSEKDNIKIVDSDYIIIK